MINYIVKQLAYFVVVLGIVSLLSFLLIYLVPGDPALVMAGLEAPQEVVQAIRETLGLNRPFLERMGEWYKNLVLHGDLGYSYFLDRSVSAAILERLPLTLVLTTLGLVIAWIIGFPLGILAAVRQNSIMDYMASVIVVFGQSIPNFWLGLILIQYIAIPTRWFPTGGYTPFSDSVLGAMRSLFLPALTLGLISTSQIARMVRSSMLEVLNTDYIKTAHAKGLPDCVVITRHALRNALIPVLTVTGVLFATLISGAVVIETVFTLPGVGRLACQSILRRDYPVLQGVLLVIAGITVLTNTVVDILYGYLDPRIRYD